MKHRRWLTCAHGRTSFLTSVILDNRRRPERFIKPGSHSAKLDGAARGSPEICQYTELVRSTYTRAIEIPRRVVRRVSRLGIHCQTITGSPPLTHVPKSDSDQIDTSHATHTRAAPQIAIPAARLLYRATPSPTPRHELCAVGSRLKSFND